MGRNKKGRDFHGIDALTARWKETTDRQAASIDRLLGLLRAADANCTCGGLTAALSASEAERVGSDADPALPSGHPDPSTAQKGA